MTTAASVALAAAAVFAVGDWIAKARDNRPLEYVCKPATLIALIVVAITLDPTGGAGARRDWFVAALVCSLAGDVFLMLPRDAFVAGLASFLVAHICYVIGFWTDPPAVAAFVLAAAVVACAVAPLAVRILRSLSEERELRPPVAVYMAVISVMLATALATGNAVAGAGAALFVGSDAMIAWNRFVRPFAAADVAIMVTYHVGQAALVCSLLV